MYPSGRVDWTPLLVIMGAWMLWYPVGKAYEHSHLASLAGYACRAKLRRTSSLTLPLGPLVEFTVLPRSASHQFGVPAPLTE
jgi:hypothetical protein